MKSIKLSNGLDVPVIGLGTSLRGKTLESTQVFIDSVKYAIEIGYRHIDTAKCYNNEHLVAKAIQESSVKREDLFITTKLYPDDLGYEKTLKAFEKSCNKLQVKYIDLYLIHFPGQPIGSRKAAVTAERAKELRLESWRALEKLYADKRCGAIGVSNYLERHLNEIVQAKLSLPMVNQCEFHVYYNNKELLHVCNKLGVQFEGYSPLGKGNILKDNLVIELAAKYHKTPAQIAIRWSIQNGVLTIPGSVTLQRIKENFNVFDFELSKHDLESMWKLNINDKVSWDPTDVI